MLNLSFAYSQNLVPNPSFEDYKKLDCEWIRFLDPSGNEHKRLFDSLLYNWSTPNEEAGVDVFSTLISPSCFQNTTDCLSVYCTTNPLSIGAYPKDGNNMCLISVVDHYKAKADERSYLQAPLVTKLTGGAKYLGGYYTMLPNTYFGDYACNNLGMLFSSDAVSSSSLLTSDLLKYTPQVNQEEVNKDHGIWKKVFGCFTAKGDEQFLTIGNFYDDNHTKAELIVDHYDQGSDFAAVVIDSVFTEEIKEPFIPNVITPNGDGLNEKFVIENTHFGWWSIDIYNRWGKSVYHSTDYRNTWNGGNLSAGVYYYDLHHRCPGITYKGALTIIR